MLNEKGATCWRGRGGGLCFSSHDCRVAVSAPAIRLAQCPLTIVYWLEYQYASPQHESAWSLKSVFGSYVKKDKGKLQQLYSQLALLTLQTLQMMHKMETSQWGETRSEAIRHLGEGPDVHSCSVNTTKPQTFCSILVAYIWLWKTLHLTAC